MVKIFVFKACIRWGWSLEIALEKTTSSTSLSKLSVSFRNSSPFSISSKMSELLNLSLPDTLIPFFMLGFQE